MLDRYLVVDGAPESKVDTVDPTSGLTVEAFEEALKEDNAALAAEFGVPELPDAGVEGEHEEEEHVEEAVPVSEAVASVRGGDEPYNWVLIAPRM